MVDDACVRVALISKPIMPPWTDGTKALARNVLENVGGVSFIQLNRLGDHAYQPSLFSKMHLLWQIARCGEDVHVFHFFFAPNSLTSTVLRFLLIFKSQKTVHTVCSHPDNVMDWKDYLFADHTIVLSEQASEAVQALTHRRVQCIPPGIHLPDINVAPSQAENPWLLKKGQHEQWLLYAGDYEVTGGHEFVLRLFAKMHAKNLGLKLVMAGRLKTKKAKSIETDAKVLAQTLGIRDSVVFVNEVESMSCLIQASDVVLFPATSLKHKVDMPYVLLEAMTWNRPVVVSTLPSLMEMAKGVEGMAISMQDMPLWINTVELLLEDDDKAKVWTNDARTWVQKHFRIDYMAEQYSQIYKALIQNYSETAMKSYYADFSEHYENSRHSGYHEHLDSLEADALKVGLNQQTKVLEVGCGTGLILERIRGLAGTIQGVDLSEPMLQVARQKGFDVSMQNACDLKFESNHFDLTYSFKVLPHVKDIHKALHELARVTRPGGRIVVDFYHRISWRYVRWRIRKALKDFRGSRHLTEADIYVRYDCLEEIKTYLPEGVRIQRVHGIMSWTIAAFIYKIPILNHLFRWLESRTPDAVSRRIGGFLLVTLEKE